jgi:hypothetical protein
MVEILNFDEALRHRAHSRPSKALKADDSFSFWPEVSCGRWVEGTPVDPANSQGSVLFDVFLILGATAAVAAVVSLLVGTPPAM